MALSLILSIKKTGTNGVGNVGKLKYVQNILSERKKWRTFLKDATKKSVYCLFEFLSHSQQFFVVYSLASVASHSVGLYAYRSTYLLGSSFNATQIPWIHTLFIPCTSLALFCCVVCKIPFRQPPHLFLTLYLCFFFLAHQNQTLYSLIRVCCTMYTNTQFLSLAIWSWSFAMKFGEWAWMCVCMCVNHNSKNVHFFLSHSLSAYVCGKKIPVHFVREIIMCYVNLVFCSGVPNTTPFRFSVVAIELFLFRSHDSGVWWNAQNSLPHTHTLHALCICVWCISC